MDRGTSWATVHRVAKSRAQLKRLSRHLAGAHVLLLKVGPDWRLLTLFDLILNNSVS